MPKIDHFPHEFCPGLPEKDYYAAQIAIQKMRVDTAAEILQYQKEMEELKKESRQRRRSILGDELYQKIQRFNKEQKQARSDLELKSTQTRQEFEELEREKAQLFDAAEKFYDVLGHKEQELASLCESIGEQKESIYQKTIGKGKKALAKDEKFSGSDEDPEFHPPLSWAYDEHGPADSVRGWLNRSRGIMGANMQCSLRDCGEDDSRSSFYRNYWIMGGSAWRRGRISAFIDIHPRRLRTTISVRDNAGRSGVDVRRSFRLFSQLVMPHDSGRVYWNIGEHDPDQLIHTPTGVATAGGARYRMPFYYREKRHWLHSFNHTDDIDGRGHTIYNGMRVSDDVWRYHIQMPDIVDEGRAVMLAVGIDFYNSVWGNDCTVFSELDFEFSTPTIAWDIF